MQSFALANLIHDPRRRVVEQRRACRPASALATECKARIEGGSHLDRVEGEHVVANVDIGWDLRVVEPEPQATVEK